VDVAHLALDLGAGHQGGHGVDDHHVERPGANEHVGDLERLLPGVGLRDEQLVDVDAQGFGVHRVEGMLGVDESGDAPVALRLGDDVQGESGLAAALGPKNLHDAAPRHAPDAEGEVKRQGTRGDGGDRLDLVGPELHDGALAELPLDLGDGHIEGLVPFH
jgi:hypothetical protein